MLVIFINVYKGRGCGDLAANIGPTNENPSPIQFLINLLTAQRNLYLDSFRTSQEKEMATRSSTLAWRIPGTGKPGGLPSMGSHRVGHD